MNIQYPYLPEGKQINYVNGSDEFIKLAENAARFSPDQNQPTGAVAVLDGKIIFHGSNMTPLKSDLLIKAHKKLCIRKFFKIKSGEKYYLCPGCAGSENHAEYRVAKMCIKDNIKNFDMYLWGHWWCCESCWGKMIEAGVRDVYLLENSKKLFDPKEEGNIVGKHFK